MEKSKNTLIFLISVFACSLIGFGKLIYTASSILSLSSADLLIFILSGLVPALLGLFLNRREIPKLNFKFSNLFFLVLFLLINTTLFKVFGTLSKISISAFLNLFLICLLTFSLQEITWNTLVYEHFLKNRSFSKSIAIVGLFKTLSYLPLFMMRDSFLLPGQYAYFSAYIIGISAMSYFLKTHCNFLISVLFISLLYPLLFYVKMSSEQFVIMGIILFLIVYLSQLRFND